MFSDQVRDTSTTTGTGDITVSGTAPSGHFTFAEGYDVGDVVSYVIEQGTEREVVIGKLLTSTTLSRETVLRSTNANAPVNFSAGTKDVYAALPADVANISTSCSLIEACRTLR